MQIIFTGKGDGHCIPTVGFRFKLCTRTMHIIPTFGLVFRAGEKRIVYFIDNVLLFSVFCFYSLFISLNSLLALGRNGYDYDIHIPLIIFGKQVKSDTYSMSVNLNDLASTLATMLGVSFPSGNDGRVLFEALNWDTF